MFILITFIVGTFAYFLKYKNVQKANIQFNYIGQDSLFEAAEHNLINKKQKNVKINVDSKQELLDFSNNKLKSRNKLIKSLTDKSININTADIPTLILLPGIGDKTAKNIVNYRQTVKKFGVVEDLMKIKGIGKRKFKKIKKYLIIEK